ncbi:hypothetical protein FG078_07265 [Vibrio cholerae]|nr:hypothetical protein [Vibrio cholerae]EGR0507810.1 hypothetical protein [Vibrio cholerae]EGR4138720.1 hypothetical protein [Vibrio cholerae]KAA1228131.1 hypothetical protein F0Q18_00050 [Vibrio cholerae]TQP34186.1 hypothetical protein FLM01_15480 [Vibrio cholerae]
MLAQWHTERCQETKAKLKKKTPLSLSLVGSVLTRSNPATNRCSLHLFLDSLLYPSAQSVSSPS